MIFDSGMKYVDFFKIIFTVHTYSDAKIYIPGTYIGMV